LGVVYPASLIGRVDLALMRKDFEARNTVEVTQISGDDAVFQMQSRDPDKEIGGGDLYA
jgi:hypothetical protein